MSEQELELLKDKARLDWLIKQGPPGAAVGAGLNDEAWHLAVSCVTIDPADVDSVVVRRAIDAAMEAQP